MLKDDNRVAHQQQPDNRAELLKLLLAERDREAARIKPYPRILRDDRVCAPTSFAQQRLWFTDQLAGASSAYHIGGSVRLRGNLDCAALEAALDAIVARHEVLRTVYENVDGVVLQTIAPRGSVSLKVVDMTESQNAESESEIHRYASEEMNTPFDLSTGPLLRVQLLQLSQHEHVLLIIMHHIVSDGWSMNILIKELGSLYALFHDGGKSTLPPLAIQYADYAEWQRRWLAGSERQRHLQYWTDNLRGAPALLELPTDRLRPRLQSFRGASVELTLSAELSERLRALARKYDVTVFMAVSTGFAILLSRLSGQNDVVIGTPAANRQRMDVEGLIGCFVNMLALRVDVSDDPSVHALLERVRAISLSAYSHQALPFEQVVEAVQPVRSVGHSPIFQAMLALQNAPESEFSLPGLTLVPQIVPYTSAQYDLVLSMQESGRQIVGSINYASDLFDQSTIGRWAGHFKALLEGMTEDVDQKVSEVSLLGAIEREEIVRSFNATEVAYPNDRMVHELFEEQVARVPDSIAVTYGDQELTYQQLNERSNRLAKFLRAQGVGPDRLVALCIERGVEMVVALLGTLKAGGAYVPLDPNQPRERLEQMLEDASPQVVLTQEKHLQGFSGASAVVVVLDAHGKTTNEQASGNLAVSDLGLKSQNLAYVIYTSGSTGRPKGVMVEHRQLGNLVAAIQECYGTCETDRILQFVAPTFDVSALEVFAALTAGATLCLRERDDDGSPGSLFEFCELNRISILHLPVALWSRLVERAHFNVPNHLRVLAIGGEQPKLAAVNKWFLRASGACMLVNQYGPTEATVCASTCICIPNADADPSIGRPISNTQIYILDGHLQPAPLGVVGEIYIGGAGVARGYLNRPELTAERFLPDPFSAEPGARIYKSGDLGRYRADGTIEYLGRNDHQVKIRGFRIELGEIESQLCRHAQVNEAVVVAREEVPGEKRLVAYVTHTEGAPSIDELRTQLQAHLPEYMVPSAYVLLEHFPLTPNGKVDRKALPAPELGAYSLKQYEAPQGEIEQALATIWQELLQVERVGRYDNFFELGGHSLLIVQLIDRLRRLGLHTEVRSVFDCPSLSALASTVTSTTSTGVQVPPNLIPTGCEAITPSMLPLIELSQAEIDRIVATVPGGASNVQDIYPLAPSQEGLLFHHVLNERNGDAYVLTTLLSLESRAQLDALLSAIQGVIDRHDILRTAVLWKELPRPVQVVYRRATLPVKEIRLQTTQDAVAQLKERLASKRIQMNLQSAPLLRIEQAVDERDRCYVLLYLHHLAGDHVALELIQSEVQAHLTGQSPALPEPLAYRNYVAQALAQAQQNDAGAFFKAKLGTVEEPTAPFGLLDVHGDGSEIEEVRRAVAPELAQRIRRSARRLNVSAATLFHAAYALVIAHTSGKDEVVFGSVLLGRMQGVAGAQHMLGMFINTLPLRVPLNDVDARQLIAQVQSELVELVKYEQASLAEAQRCSGISGNAPLFSALLNYRHSAPLPNQIESESGIEVLAGHERTNYPFTVSVDDLGAGFEITAQIDRRIDADRVTGYVEQAIASLVTALESHPETPALQLSILPQSEQHRLLSEFNVTDTQYPHDQLIHELFEAQVETSPDAIAVRFADQQLTYRELNGKANQVAQYLRSQGVGPDQLVAICVERSAEMVIALLGVLKSGGAYVPIDPSYPADRVAYMLADAAPRVVLTQASLKSGLPASTATLIALDTEWNEIAQHSEHPLIASDVGVTSRHLAYVIYTSGSTGKPKGVMVEHGNVVRLFAATEAWFGFSERDVWTLFHSVAFDFSVWELWGALLHGGRLVVVPQLTARSPQAFYRLLCEEGVTVLNQTPSAFTRLIAAQAADPEAHASALRLVIFGGEALALHSLQPWVARNGAEQPRLVNMYGITETTVHVTYRALTDQEIESDRSSVVGRPIPDLQVYLLDAQRQPVPIGVCGEIYIGGAGVARGYLNREDLTAERFIPDPFSSRGHARLYRSGDLGRYRADGTIEYLGRNDHQVKIRGFRIELGEIESQLTKHPSIQEAVVVAREDVPGEKRLVAYLTHTEVAPSIDELRTQLQAHLPEYMVPSAYVVMATFPLTPNGKLDRNALPAPELGAYSLKQYEAPHGEIEQALARIWQELLQVERVGRHDNFFALGGHSLLIVQLIDRLRSTGWQTEVRDVFNAPTLSALASTVTSTTSAGVQVPPNLIPTGCEAITPAMVPLIELSQAEVDQIVHTVPGGASNVQDIYPLAPLQEGLLFHHLLNEQGDTYILPTLMVAESRAQLDALLNAIQRVIDRHDILRTAIVWQGLSRSVQVVYRRAPVWVQELALDTSDDAVSQLKRRMAPGHLRIDLQQAPLIRVEIAQDAASEQWYALLYYHHIISDHVALELIQSEVQAHLTGQSPALPEPLAYRNYVAQALAQAQQNDAGAFFKAKLGTVEEPTAPFGLLDVHGDGSEIEEVRRAVAPELAQRIRRSARRLNVSAATLFHAAYALVIAHTSGKDEVVFGSVLLGRMQGVAGAQHMLGMFINTLPLRVPLNDVDARQLIAQVQSELVELVKYEQASLAEAQRCSGISGNAPLFSALLNYRHSAPLPNQIESESGIEVLAGHERTNYPFTVSVDDLGAGFEITAQIDRRIDADRVTGYVEQAIASLVTALESHPETPALQLSILPQSEQHRLLSEFNVTDTQYPHDQLIHELFEAQVETSPDAIAVRFADQQLTYRELNGKANQVAQYLRSQGVGPDQLVAICVERSAEMVIALLGVLKSGGAYVPIDPSYPADRVAYMLADAAPRVVLTQASLKSGLPATSAELIALDEGWSEIERELSDNLSVRDVGVTDRHLAYVIYTSGSTGKPKGVMVEQSGLRNYLQWALANYAAEGSAGSVVTSSFAFDATVTSLYTPLLSGGVVTLVKEGEELEGVEAAIQGSKEWSFLKISPAHLQVLGQRLEQQGLKCVIRAMVIGGEALSPATVRLWQSLSPATRLINEYGPTETVVGCSVYEVPGAWGLESVPIGRPIANTQIYLLDPQRQPVPLGVVGEIYIGGAGVARGYLNREDLTAERFIPDPFSNRPNARIYKSGDLGRYRADGTIEYLGRNDSQVKIRGFRIELGEIESQLTKHPGIQEAVVLAREDVPGEKRLVAYLTHTEVAPSIDELRTQLQAHLPEYMVPSAYVLLKHFPLTPNGKVDRKALPAPELTAYSLKQYEAPQGEIEQTLATIWEELLQVERVGRHDNFFELGGHSLLIGRMVEQLRRVQLHAQVRSVFSTSTLGELASTLTRIGTKVVPLEIPPNPIPAECAAITPVMLPLIELSQGEIDRIVQTVPGGASNIQDMYPLAPLQEGILFHHLLNTEGDAYILPALMTAESRAQLDVLLSAIQRVIDRHDILRTAVLWKELPQAVQVVYRRAPLPIEERELDPNHDPVEQFKAWMAPGQLRIDLQRAPLIRVQVARDVRGSRWYALLYFHHIISDHVALEIIQSEVQAHLQGRIGSLAEPLAYRGYVAQALAQARRQDATTFFHGKLSDITATTAPFDVRDVHGDGSEIIEARRNINPELAQRIRRSARRMNVSSATLFHAAYALVIAHTSGRDDVVFGSVLLGRLQGTEGVDRVLGMFINTLPLRLRLQNLDGRQLIEQTQRELMELLDYEHASLSQAQRCSGISGNAPLFSAVLNYRHSATHTSTASDQSAIESGGGVEVVAGYVRNNYPFTVSVDDLGEGFNITALTDRRIDADRVTGYVQRAIESLVAALESHAETPVLQLSILPECERRRLLIEFNATATDYPQGKLIHELFEEQVAKSPDALALRFEEQQLTYGELNRKANQLAQYLRRQGVVPDQLVAICVERSVEMVVGLLGVLKAGGAYVPLDPSYPVERLALLLQDVSPRVVLTQAKFKGALPSTNAVVIALDSDWERIDAQPTTNPVAAELGLNSRHLAYVIYTSGSTGKPKGVMVEHRNLVNYALYAVQKFDVAGGEGSLFLASFSTDLGLTGFYPTLICGQCIRLCPESRELDLLVAALLAGKNLSPVKMTPTHLAMIQDSIPHDRLSGLVNALVLGGEALSASVIAPWRTHAPATRIFNHYGPTETTIGCIVYEIPAEAIDSVPLGRPIANAKIYILDAQRQPAPLEVVGEIYIGGAGVARGYLHREELTAERFLPDPFSGEPGARIYKSGDLGRFRADGTIEYLGRNDSQVKVRGFRIELGEIESQLARHPNIKEAVVIAREDVPREKRLVAYVKTREGAPSSEALREFLKVSLPEYMVPTAYVLVETFPVTPNGKLDRKALPAPELSAYSVKQYEAPQGETEISLAGLWQELLHVERVGRRDNFFELGGHSLLAVQLANRIQQVLGRELALRDVFEHPTIHALSKQLRSADSTMMAAITAADHSQLLPLSFTQQRLWFIDQLEGGGGAYHIAGGVRLRGVLDIKALRAALNSLIDRHEILRTVFSSVDGSPVQVIAKDARFALQSSDLSDQPVEEREAEVTRQASEEAQGRFDLSVGPLIRGRLIRLSDEEHVLLVTMHHIVSDGWSMGILVREVAALYAAYREGRANPLTTLPIQYADYAVWQRAWLQGAVLEDQLRYWTEHLSGAPTLLALPTDRLRPAVQSYRGTSVDFVLSAELSEQLKRLSRQHDATLFMTLYTAFAILLSRLSGQQDIVIGTSVANRQRTEIEELIGLFLNTLALRVQLSGDPSVSGLLSQVKAMALTGYSHQELPFEQVVEAIQPVRSLSHSPVFQVMLVLQNAPQGELVMPGLTLSPQALSNTSAQLDLRLEMHEVEERIVGSINYASDLFDRATIERWSEYFEVVLTAMVADSEQRVSAIELLSQAERDQLIQAFNATESAYPKDQLIHELFEAQVARTPDAIAVRFEGQSLTYRELNQKANQVAQYLRSQGVGPDQLVAICVERSAEMVIALLGVLKSGGAYVPIDPSYPADRVAYMLADAAPRVVLTQARLRHLLQVHGATVIALDEQWSEIAHHSEHTLIASDVGVTDRHLAYVIYTSGSTGKPKGVMVEQAGLRNYLQWALANYEAEGGAGTVVTSSFAFDATVTSLYTPLLSGGVVTLVKEGEELEGVEAAIQGSKEWSFLKISPAHLQVLGQRLEQQGLKSRIRAMVIGGEALSPATVRLWQSLSPATRLINEYGPTETVVGCSVYEVPGAWGLESVPIGRPIANTQIYLLDPQRQPVPLGVVGEIYIGGAGVARGYLNREDLTAERFIPDPFSGITGARIYKSGDLGRYRADGTIEYLGRNDSQVKIRGFRIELGEIESQLTKHPGIQEAVVLAREDVPGEKRLVAYLTHTEAAPSIDELRTQLQAHLPEYMVPSAYVLLDHFPLTPNGKLDRNALPAPELTAYSLKQYEAPQGEIEQALASIWQELLQVERVGRHDNFFELGGHSLLIVQLIDRLRSTGLHAEVRDVFSAPTLSALASTVGATAPPQVSVPPNLIPSGCEAITPEMLPLIQLSQAEIDRIVQTVPGGASNVQDIYPLAPLQEGLLFHHLLNEESGSYLLPTLMVAESRTQLDALVAAIQRVIDRHDILRTAILWNQLSRSLQVVYRRAVLPVEELQLPVTEDIAEQLKARMAPGQLRMDLQRAPLMRVEISQEVGTERWYALLYYHHIISDHVALEIIQSEVKAHLTGQSAALPEPLAYRGYVAQAVAQARQNDAAAFFHAKLGTVDEPTAPFGLLNVHGDGTENEEARRGVDAELAQRIRRSARRLNVSAATLFHAAYALVIAQLSGKDDVVFGSVLLGRLQGTEGADRVLGMFMNTLPVRVQLQDINARQLIEQMQRELVELVKYEQASLAEAQRCSGVDGNAPLFSAVLNYRHSAPTNVDNTVASGLEMVASYGRTNYPFTVSIDDLGDGFGITAQIDRRIDADRMTGYVHRTIESLVQALESGPDTPALQVSILPKHERRQLLIEFNATQVAYPQDQLIHELFEAQVARTPDAIAVRFEGQSLSYRDLNDKANQVAHYLRSQGVGPDQLVAICVERSAEMVIALLGVLKSGSAYVPIDPSYPADRVAYMLADAAPRVVLTQARLRHLLQVHGATVIALDEQWSEIAHHSDHTLIASDVGVTDRHLAYVIYTSGSTGKPKGVMVEQSGLRNYLQWALANYAAEGSAGTVVTSSFAFDATVTSLYTPLLSGGVVTLVKEGEELEGLEAVLQGSKEWSFLKISPAHLQVLGQRLEQQGLKSRIRAMVIGGEALSPATVRLWQSLSPATRLINEYGPTETVVGCSVYEVPGGWGLESVPIGRPIANTQIYILDPQRQPVPLGVVGEIYIGGAGVARGYLNREDLTAERFIPDPFSNRPNARLYKSGDLGRYRADGTIEYLGRNDSQVKIRGFRIELGEIESQLTTHPSIQEAVVLAREDVPGEKRLVAYLTHTEVAPSIDELRTQLQAKLPEYMVPSAYVLLDHFPLTPNGKLDRNALPAPELTAYSLKQYEAPQGEIEQALARIWQELLQVERVGRHDNFFELGGHSLFAIQLLTQLRERRSVGLPMRAIFESPTLMELAERINLVEQLGKELEADSPAAEKEQTEEGWV